MQSNYSPFGAIKSPSESQFATFLANNDNPPLAVLTETRSILSEPTQELERKDEEIEHFQRTLKALEAERDALEKSLLEYEPIQSPMRRLPSDILHEIFYHCLPTHRNPVMSIAEPPLLLTLVCKSWRSVALSSPRLWARLHIPSFFPRNPSTMDDSGWNSFGLMPWESDHNRATELEDTERMLHFRRQLVQRWLSRSGSLPLIISLSYDGVHDPSTPGESLDENPIKQILNIIFSFSSTIAGLELSMTFGFYQTFLSDIPPTSIPMLHKLRLNLIGSPIPDLGPVMGFITLLQAPKLQNLSIMARCDLFSSPPEGVLSMVDNLTNLSIHHTITSADSTKILRRCHRVRFCKLTIADHPDEPQLDSQGTILLPHLSSLVLSVSVTTDGMLEIYKKIYAPNLANFGYQQFVHWTYRSLGRSRMESSRPSTGVHHLVEKASSLRTLFVDASIVTPEDILLCLRSSSQITNLVLGQHFNHLEMTTEYAHWNPAQKNFDLGLLILPDGSRTDDGVCLTYEEATTACKLLLPKLEVFTGYLMADKISARDIKRFVLGRLGTTATRNGISSLRRVEMTFERPQREDIKAEIQHVAKEEGVEIKVEFQYFPPYESDDDSVYSPWYGLLNHMHVWGSWDEHP